MFTENTRLSRIARMVAGGQLDMTAPLGIPNLTVCDWYSEPVALFGQSDDLHAIADVQRTEVILVAHLPCGIVFVAA